MTSTPVVDRTTTVTRIAAVVIFVAGAFMQLWRLGTDVLTEDEVTYAHAGTAYLHGDSLPNPEHPPLAKLFIGLSEAVLGHGPIGMRLLGALLGLGLAGLLLWWLRRELGPVPALFGTAAWLLVPHVVEGSVRGDRLALLEPYVTFFSLAAVICAWEWRRDHDTRWLIACGVASGCGIASKFTALPAVLVASAIIGCDFWTRQQRARVFAVPAMSLSILALLYLVTFRTRTLATIHRMLAQQSALRDAGRITIIDGHRYLHPPWWSYLYTQTLSIGKGFSILLAALCLVAWCARRTRGLATLLASVVIADLLFMHFIVKIDLDHYYLLWQPELAALAAVGFAGLLQIRLRRIPLLAAAAVVALVAVIVPALDHAARLQPTGLEVVASTVRGICTTDASCTVDNSRDISVLETYLGHQVTAAAAPLAATTRVVVLDESILFDTQGVPELYAALRRSATLILHRGRFQIWEITSSG